MGSDALGDAEEGDPEIRALASGLPREGELGACPSNLLLRAAMLSLRAECSKNGLCGVALLRLRAVFLRSRSRVGLPALATDITRTAS